MKSYLKKILFVSLASSSVFAASNFENEADSLKLYNTNLEKTIIEEMVASIVHEENIFNLFNEYVLKTGDTTIEDKTNPTKLTFMKWYNITNNSSNNFVRAYNHDGLINITFDDKTNVLTISNTLKKENSFATKRYIEELKSRNIRHSFNANGYSIIPYKLPLKTIKFLMKYKEIKADGLYLTNQQDLKTYSNPLPLKSSIYVPNGKGEFLLYVKDKDTDGTIKVFYKGLVKTFDGVIINGNKADGSLLNDDEINAELDKKLPRLKGSIGYVSTSIQINETNKGITYKDEKSSIVEYIFNDSLYDDKGVKLPGRWVKKFSSVNRESSISANLSDKGVNYLSLSSSNDMFIPDRYHEINTAKTGSEEESNFNLFGSAFVGGLYNKSNVYDIKSLSTTELSGLYTRLNLSSLIDVNKYDLDDDAYYLSKEINDYFDDQYKIAFFKPYKTLDFDFKDIFAKSYIYSNVGLKTIAGSLEKLTIKAINYGLDTSFKPDTSSCLAWGEDYNYDPSTDKCVKTTYDCKGWNVEKISVNGGSYCHDTSDAQAICKDSERLGSQYDYFYNSKIYSNKCVDEVQTLGKGETYITDSGKKYRVDYSGDLCSDHLGKTGLFIVQSKDSYWGKPAGCYWNKDKKLQDYKNPYCGKNEIRVGGVCKSLLNDSLSIKNASCKETKAQNSHFMNLIEDYMFKNKLDKNLYAFDNFDVVYNEVSVKDDGDNKTYKICESISFSVDAFKQFYVYPNFDIAFLNIENQGKTEVVVNPNVKYVYRESNITECNIDGSNCNPIFDKKSYLNSMQKGLDLTIASGNILKANEKLSYKVFPTTKRFQIRSEDYKNSQSLPYTSFNQINNNIEPILNSSSSYAIKLNSINLSVYSNSSTRMKLNSGIIDINSDK